MLAVSNKFLSKVTCNIIFYGQNVEHKNYSTIGVPFVSVTIGGEFKIGRNLKMNNTLAGNPIGRSQRCIFFVNKNAQLIIGNNVGISQTAIVCHKQIIIEDNVKIGGGTCIYDTDFHSIDPNVRKNPKMDRAQKANAAVVIKANAFIGANSTILKGVTIGENSVIGACSLVTKSVPDNEIWAGNPAKFVKAVHVNNNIQLSIY
ncbi:transferase [Nostoc linckia z14]|nr:transferase [Nostoc linckia z14]